MDNNNTTSQAPQPVTAPQMPQAQPVPVTVPAPQPVLPQQEHGSGMKMIVMLFVIIILVVAILGTSYWYMSTQNKQITAPTANQQQSQQAINQINAELGAVEEMGSVDEEFTEVDTDTESL